MIASWYYNIQVLLTHAHIVYYNTVIVCTPHPCSSSCIITVLYCIVIQYYYLHYAFDDDDCITLQGNCLVKIRTWHFITSLVIH